MSSAPCGNQYYTCRMSNRKLQLWNLQELIVSEKFIDNHFSVNFGGGAAEMENRVPSPSTWITLNGFGNR